MTGLSAKYLSLVHICHVMCHYWSVFHRLSVEMTQVKGLILMAHLGSKNLPTLVVAIIIISPLLINGLVHLPNTQTLAHLSNTPFV